MSNHNGRKGRKGLPVQIVQIVAIRRQNSEIPWCLIILIILIRFGGYHPKASGEKCHKSEAIARLQAWLCKITCALRAHASCSKLQLLKFPFVLILPVLPEKFETADILFEQVLSLFFPLTISDELVPCPR